MISVTVVMWETKPVARQLIDALMTHTDLDSAEADALARNVLSAVPYEVRTESKTMGNQVAKALKQCGAKVVIGDGRRR
jgi:hypothetical protein